MAHILNLKKFSFLVYGLGSTGQSVIQYFKKRKIHDFYVWDDNLKLRKKFSLKGNKNLNNILKKVDYVILSPGISLKNSKYKKELKKFEKKGWPESTVVIRFWIISIILAMIGLATLKLR